jgi:phenylalanyl-tRNA synthetase beta chain
LTETVSYVTVSETMLRATGTPDSDQVGVIRTVKLNELIRLKNPLQADRPFLRTMLVPSLLEIAAANLKHRSSVRIFELARLYLPNGTDNLPTEVHALGLVMAGDRERLSIFKPTGEFDFFDLKGVIDEVLMRAGIAELTFEHLAHPAFHPGRCAAVSAQGARLAVLGEVHPTVAEYFGITDRRVAAAEVDLDAVLKMAGTERAEVRVPRFLPVEQDFAVTVDEPVTSAEVEETLRQGAGSLLTAIQLFDIYRGPQLGEGKKSLAYRLTFTAPDRALTDSDLTKIRTRIQRIVAQRVNGQLRV